MYTEFLSIQNKTKYSLWRSFLKNSSLDPDEPISRTVLLWDDNENLIATGSRDGNVLKCIAVDEAYQGQGLTATLITELRKEAFADGINHLFLYTKPKNKMMFTDLFFYPVAQTEKVLLLEDKKDGINKFLNTLTPAEIRGNVGCIVMNCNPFTLGHQYLIETASKECDLLYVFVVSEDKSRFSKEDRMEMVRRGTAHISNVCVVPTGPYLISSATFPTYFLDDRENVSEVQCQLDIEIFINYYVPKFNISVRYVGTEPLSPTTNKYNCALKEYLPSRGVILKEIPRIEKCGAPISASRIRALLDANDLKALKSLVPDTTYNYLTEKGII